jgi:hypothetical protein
VVTRDTYVTQGGAEHRAVLIQLPAVIALAADGGPTVADRLTIPHEYGQAHYLRQYIPDLTNHFRLREEVVTLLDTADRRFR